MGAALVAMVAELTIGRPDATEHEGQLQELLARASEHRAALLNLAESDAAAYAAVAAARRLPKDSEEEREERTRRVRTTMRAAAEVPLQTARTAAEVLDLARRIAPIGNPNAVSDAGVAAQLAAASVRGALLNVRINLPYLPAGEPLLDSAPGEIERLEQAAADGERDTLEVVGGRLTPS
jgi:formiminotetrahydrofolate cyclodeaminase